MDIQSSIQKAPGSTNLNPKCIPANCANFDRIIPTDLFESLRLTTTRNIKLTFVMFVFSRSSNRASRSKLPSFGSQVKSARSRSQGSNASENTETTEGGNFPHGIRITNLPGRSSGKFIVLNLRFSQPVHNIRKQSIIVARTIFVCAVFQQTNICHLNTMLENKRDGLKQKTVKTGFSGNCKTKIFIHQCPQQQVLVVSRNNRGNMIYKNRSHPHAFRDITSCFF